MQYMIKKIITIMQNLLSWRNPWSSCFSLQKNNKTWIFSFLSQHLRLFLFCISLISPTSCFHTQSFIFVNNETYFFFIMIFFTYLMFLSSSFCVFVVVSFFIFLLYVIPSSLFDLVLLFKWNWRKERQQIKYKKKRGIRLYNFTVYFTSYMHFLKIVLLLVPVLLSGAKSLLCFEYSWWWWSW